MHWKGKPEQFLLLHKYCYSLIIGSVGKNLLFFSLPYLLSYFLQTLYGMADLYIIGQFDGVAATTAVSVGSQVMHMITVMLVELAMGATVTIAQAVGRNDKENAAENIGNTVILFVAVSVILTTFLLVMTRGICTAMSTLAEARCICGKKAFQTVQRKNDAYSSHRNSDCIARRLHSDCIYIHYHHCQPQRDGYCRGVWREQHGQRLSGKQLP